MQRKRLLFVLLVALSMTVFACKPEAKDAAPDAKADNTKPTATATAIPTAPNTPDGSSAKAPEDAAQAPTSQAPTQAPTTQAATNAPDASAPADAPKKTPEDARAFVKRVDAELRALSVAASRAEWEKSTNITPETEAAAAAAGEKMMAFNAATIAEAASFSGLDLDPDTARQILLMRTMSWPPPSPKDPALREELSKLATGMESVYGKAKHCPTPDTCQDLSALEKIIGESRDPAVLLAAWKGWHDTAAVQRADYTRFTELANQGALAIGFADLGLLWRMGYDMPPEAFEAEVERLWTQLDPLYKELHCYTRQKLSAHYGPTVVPPDGLIPAHLLGNMWAQSWDNIYPILEPFPGRTGLDITKALVDQKYDELRMVKLAESFFTSLGMDPLPATFWERSMFKKPEGREVVCHASAWDVEYNDDLRIKMCININQEDLITIHHELGHNYYFHYYFKLPMLFQNGANDGFHEAIGDALALSVTPSYLKKVGLLDQGFVEDEKALINVQMQTALQKISFLPFGKLIDQWRWDVFAGRTKPEQYNTHWWKLRAKYQGIAPPVPRTEADFDPGAKYHIPANVPYTRYFLATVLQFQFHRALCQAAGHTGPLHTCSIHGSAEAGARLQAMLAMGASKPWPDALEALTGSRQMDATAIIDYFAPLMAWLQEQNKGQQCGWPQ
jgi:peptidyl-dipeptidase A